MIPLTVRDAATWAGGELAGIDASAAETVVAAVAVDSRAVPGQSLFVAIRGERVDGHDFAEQAVSDGAIAVLSDRALLRADGTSLPCIVVDDPVLALGRIASQVRDRLEIGRAHV